MADRCTVAGDEPYEVEVFVRKHGLHAEHAGEPIARTAITARSFIQQPRSPRGQEV